MKTIRLTITELADVTGVHRQTVSKRLQDIPPTQIRVVATATLRLAVNAGKFLAKAQEILGTPVQVSSGEEEARLIYQGVAHTTGGADQRLEHQVHGILDCGGATGLVAPRIMPGSSRTLP